MSSRAPKLRPKRGSAIRVVAIGASAGGIQGLLQLLPELPLIPGCSLLIVVHLHPINRSLLPEILRRCARWKVKQAEEGEPMHAGVAYIAAPDFHLVLSGDHLHLSSAKPVHMQRPSVDVLFASVAKERGSHAIGVLLSGAGRDGSDGLRLMKESGGRTIVQDPAEAMFPSMPEHGIQTGCADFVIPAHSIAPQISLLCAQG
jgi:two-component system, chemotaxis family, protein-glutamate methylesterase/glutaminase